MAGLVAGLPARLGVDPSTVRWVLADVGTEYAAWLAAGVRVDRCWDLALVQRILRHAATAPGSGVRYTPVAQLEVADPTEPERPARVPAGQESFFDLPDEADPAPDVTVLAAELAAQRAAVEGSAHPQRLRLLAAAESQGALVAAEIRAAGLPWDRGVHEALLAEQLGPRPAPGERPARLQALAERIADVLGSPGSAPTRSPACCGRCRRRAWPWSPRGSGT